MIDDDLDDQFFAQLALEKVLPEGSAVQVVHSGNQGIAYMIGEGKFSERATYPFPSLIITDLKMADGDGFHVLEFLQKNPARNVVPRLMFSNSAHEDDVRTAYMLGASAYHIKPMGKVETERRMRSIVEYWGGAPRFLPWIEPAGFWRQTAAADSARATPNPMRAVRR